MHYWKKVSTKQPWTIVALTVVVVGLLGWYGGGLFSNISNSSEGFVASDTESSRTDDRIQEAFGKKTESAIVLFEQKDASLGNSSSAAYQDEVSSILAPLEKYADQIHTYQTTQQTSFISKDQTATYAVVNLKDDTEAYSVLNNFRANADQSKLSISVGGEAYSRTANQRQVGQDLARAELISLPILLLLMVIFFRSIVAAVLPILIGVITVLGGFAIARFLDNFIPIDIYAVNVITILGLGLAIDYSLLMTNRFRESLATRSIPDAVHQVVATSGRTILFSGIIVMISLASLLFFPVEFLHSISIGGISAVAMAMLTTVLVLPSILALIGHNINRWNIIPRRSTSRAKSAKDTVWTRIAHLASRRSAMALCFGGVLIVLMVPPVMQLRSVGFDHRWLAVGSQMKHVGEVMQTNFDINTADVQAVISLDHNTSSDQAFSVACDATKQIRETPGVKSVMSATPISDQLSCATIQTAYATGSAPQQLQNTIRTHYANDTLLFSITLDDDLFTPEATSTMQRIRDITPLYGTLSVGGEEAANYDTNQVYAQYSPLAITIVLLGMFILMTALFRSIVLPLQAMLMNIISLLITVGVLLLVFQFGWVAGFTHFSSTDGVMLSALLMVLAAAFGLAMDYSVFLFSRMREVYDKTGNHQRAIEEGIIKTGPIITAAAVMFFTVVIAFAASSVPFMQVIGLGLGVAVLVDAFFVRLILAPAILRLTGSITWYAPKWLSKWHIRHD